MTRPHSEAKSWAPSSVPSAPQSAPPELAAQHKSQHSQHSGYKSPESESVSIGSFSGLNGHKDMDSERDSPLPSNVQAGGTTALDENVRISVFNRNIVDDIARKVRVCLSLSRSETEGISRENKNRMLVVGNRRYRGRTQGTTETGAIDKTCVWDEFKMPRGSEFRIR